MAKGHGSKRHIFASFQLEKGISFLVKFVTELFRTSIRITNQQNHYQNLLITNSIKKLKKKNIVCSHLVIKTNRI